MPYFVYTRGWGYTTVLAGGGEGGGGAMTIFLIHHTTPLTSLRYTMVRGLGAATKKCILYTPGRYFHRTAFSWLAHFNILKAKNYFPKKYQQVQHYYLHRAHIDKGANII